MVEEILSYYRVVGWLQFLIDFTFSTDPRS